MTSPLHISSRDNPVLKELRKLSQDGSAYRKAGRYWIEGDHLARAALLRGVQPAVAVLAESAWGALGSEFGAVARKTLIVADALFQSISGLESPAAVGLVCELPQEAALRSGAASVVLDRVQDAGNVGSILRSAAAFGFEQVVAIKGSAALWSPKVLRAGMGAHFGLHLVEGVQLEELSALQTPLVVTSSHQGQWLHEAQLPWPCTWVMGHEGQGVSAELARQAVISVRIAQPGGEESLNVAAAAAICLHASAAAHR